MIRLYCHSAVYPDNHDCWFDIHLYLSEKFIHYFLICGLRKASNLTNTCVCHFILGKAKFAIALEITREIDTDLIAVTWMGIRVAFINVYEYVRNYLKIPSAITKYLAYTDAFVKVMFEAFGAADSVLLRHNQLIH